MGLHHVYGPGFSILSVLLFPCFVELFLGIQIFVCFLLSQLFVVEEIKALPLLDDVLGKLFGLFLREDLLIHWLAVFAPPLLGKLRELVRNVLLII